MDIHSYLDDPEVFRVNTLKAHSDHKHYISKEDCRASKDELWLSLDGEWDVLYAKSPEEREVDFYKEDFPSDSFKKIRVPAHAELEGFGDIQYINTMYPW